MHVIILKAGYPMLIKRIEATLDHKFPFWLRETPRRKFDSISSIRFRTAAVTLLSEELVSRC